MRCDVERAAHHVPQRPQIAHRIVARAHHLPRVLDEGLARLGQRQLVDAAREQQRAKLLFEFLDALADRGLSPAHPLGRARERSLLDDGEKVLELKEIHGCSLPGRGKLIGRRGRVQ